LGDYIWNDKNQNGIQDSNENGVDGVKITLNETGAITTTDSSGKYQFCELENGDYSITVDKSTLPEGYEFTAKDSGSDNSIDSDINPDDGKSETITIADSNNTTLDGGIYKITYCLGDYIWNDSNKNGIQDSDENGVSGVKITLNETGDSVITGSNGEYEFCGLENGNYSITIDKDTLPEEYIITEKNIGDNDFIDSDINPTDGKSDTVSINDKDNRTVDGGVYKKEKETVENNTTEPKEPQTYCIGDYIWFDNNKNGIQDSDENGVDGVKITLNETGDIATTDSNGEYKFCGLENGDYSISIDKTTLPEGYLLTAKNQGDSEEKDSDINPDDGKSETITIADSNNTTLDGGIYKPTYCIGDYIWFDSNQNGIQDSSESGVENITITLNETGAKTKTNAQGYYEFCELENGDYSITIDKSTLPDGYEFTTKNQGDDDSKDSDIDSTGKSDIAVIKDIDNKTLDGGIYKPTYCLGDYIWYDNNKNGIQDSNETGVGGVEITLNETGAKITTDINGEYKFCGLENGDYSITIDKSTLPEDYQLTTKNSGDDDTKDSDIDSTGKSDIAVIKDMDNKTLDGGIYKEEKEIIEDNTTTTEVEEEPQTYCLGDYIWFDNNENGIQDSNENGVDGVKITLNETGAEVITNAKGYYEFCELENGEYSITIDKSTLPEGYKITNQNSGDDDTKDSDINPETAKSDSVVIKDADNKSLDGGIYKPTYCLGDYIWDDKNQNGIQDNQEQGVEGVKITLNQTGVSTITDKYGKYEFCGLENGSYSISIDISTLPDEYKITAQNSGDNDTKDSDINPNSGESDIVIIQDADNITLDGGIYKNVKTIELSAGDDIVEANTQDAITIIPVLENDSINSGVTIRLVDIKEGEVLSTGTTAVGGANLSTTNSIHVDGEGIWSVDGNNIIFTPDDGFEGTPTPIYYLVEDQQGNQSNIAEVAIKTDCTCNTYESSSHDSVSAFNSWSIVLLMFITSLASLLFFRRDI